MIECPEASEMFDRDVYAFKDVLAFASIEVGDGIRFGIHVNNRGQPQASLPVYKDGEPIDMPTDKGHVMAEEIEANELKQRFQHPTGKGAGGSGKGAGGSGK